MRRIPVPACLLLLPLLLLSACGREQPIIQGEPSAEIAPYLVAANNPLRYFAHYLLEGEPEVRLLAPAGIDPAAWQPAVEDILQLQGAELLILNGAGYEPWLDKVSLSPSKLVHTTAGVKDRWIALENQVTHTHGPQGEHAHGDLAFTTWMDFSLAREQAGAVAAALAQRWPRRAAAIEQRLALLAAELGELDRGYQRAAQALAGREFIFSHPVYQYFQRRYGLAGISLHWEPDTMPDEEEWAQLAQGLNDRSLFVWEGQPTGAIADRMAALGLDFVVIEPAANGSEREWLSVQRDNLARLLEMAQ